MTKKILVTTDELCQALSINERYIRRLIATETLKMGIHFIDVRTNQSAKPMYRWYLDLCLEYFATHPAKRS